MLCYCLFVTAAQSADMNQQFQQTLYCFMITSYYKIGITHYPFTILEGTVKAVQLCIILLPIKLQAPYHLYWDLVKQSAIKKVEFKNALTGD